MIMMMIVTVTLFLYILQGQRRSSSLTTSREDRWRLFDSTRLSSFDTRPRGGDLDINDALGRAWAVFKAFGRAIFASRGSDDVGGAFDKLRSTFRSFGSRHVSCRAFQARSRRAVLNVARRLAESPQWLDVSIVIRVVMTIETVMVIVMLIIMIIVAVD